MRMIYNVIGQILAAMPEEEQKKRPELVGALKTIAHNTLYKAPEQMPHYFRQVSYLLTDHLGDPTAPDATAWEKEIADIFADRKEVKND